MASTKSTTQTNTPEKSKTKRCVPPEDIAQIVHELCDYDDQNEP